MSIANLSIDSRDIALVIPGYVRRCWLLNSEEREFVSQIIQLCNNPSKCCYATMLTVGEMLGSKQFYPRKIHRIKSRMIALGLLLEVPRGLVSADPSEFDCPANRTVCPVQVTGSPVGVVVQPDCVSGSQDNLSETNRTVCPVHRTNHAPEPDCVSGPTQQEKTRELTRERYITTKNQSLSKSLSFLPGLENVEPPAKANPAPRRKSPAVESQEFVEFYQAYPRRQKRDEAWTAWQKQVITPALILQLEQKTRAARFGIWKDRIKEHIPLPASWINSSDWKDEDADLSASQPKAPGTSYRDARDALMVKRGPPTPRDPNAPVLPSMNPEDIPF